MRLSKVSGVTLLEVMLVLVVSAMIIVMSLRYYQAASNNLQVNGMLQATQSITALVDGLAQGTGSYLEGEVSTETLELLTTMRSPWGGTIAIEDVEPSSYSVRFTSVPVAVCIQTKSRLKANSKFDTSGNNCSSVSDFTYTYSATA